MTETNQKQTSHTYKYGSMDPQTCVFISCTLIQYHSTAHDGDNKQIQTTETLKRSSHKKQNLPSSLPVNLSQV